MLEQIEFPEPVIAVAIEPKTKVDQEKLATALQRLAEEDPTFRVNSDEETGQTVIRGMGELHLEILVDRMMREFKVEANVGKPQVAYRETIRQEADKVQGKFVRQTGGSGQYGDVVINVEPRTRARASSSRTRSRAARSRPSTSRRSKKGIVEALDLGCQGRLPDGRRQGRADRRLLSRRRLLGDGLQDRRLDGDPGGAPSAPSRSCSSRSCRSRSSPPRSSSAT